MSDYTDQEYDLGSYADYSDYTWVITPLRSSGRICSSILKKRGTEY